MQIPLFPSQYAPTTSFTGNEPPTIVRGKNVVLRAALGRTRVENYPGSKNQNENYTITGETLTGTLTWAVSSVNVTGSGTLFLSQLHLGQDILVGTEPCVVRRIISDTSFVAERPCTTNQSGVTARYLLTMFEINKQRGVMRRGSAIMIDQKGIIFTGDGTLYLDGVPTGFTATRRPKRLQRSTGGIYTEFPIGFDKVPPPPTIDPAAGGWKGMQAGNYSFMVSYWNSVTGGFSNPSPLIKKNSGGTVDIVLTAGQRLKFDFTPSLVGMPTNADGFIIWGSQSGGGVAAINTSNFNQGAWLAVKKIRTTAYSVAPADVSAANDTITIVGHKFKTADSFYTGTTFGTVTAGTEYFAIYVDPNTIKLADTATAANAGTPVHDITAAPGATVSVRSCNVTTDETFIEYLDAEMGATASGDNDPPPDCEFVTEFANQVFCLSALGAATTTQPYGTSPGNYAMPMKFSNREAFPSDWRVSVGNEITGFANGIGRLFCLTPNSLPFVTPTGRTELARLSPTLLDMPFTSRPFWTKGGISPKNVLVVQGDVFVYTGRTLLRSPTNADSNVMPYEIGLPIADLTATWYDGHVKLEHDGKNQQVCLISSATHKNAAGYWVSQILPYSLQKNEWQPIIELSDNTRDMIVSGAANINDRMYILAGGRTNSGAYTMSTFLYDEATSGTPVAYYIAFQPTDLGEEGRQKFIDNFRLTGRINSGIIQVHGARAGGEINITDIENGTNSLSGNIALNTLSVLTRDYQTNYLVKGLQIFSVRIAGEWPGTGSVDRIDEVVLSGGLHGIAQ